MYQNFLSTVEKYNSIVIFGHPFPDGDCYGSQIALRNILKDKYPNKQIFAVGDGLPEFFPWLGFTDEVSEEIIKDSLIILVDGNDLNRMSDPRCKLGKAFFKIDHHIDNNGYKEGEEILQENASSTCEIITDIVMELDLPLNPIAASALYLGNTTDSGRFVYVDDYLKTFKQVQYLVEHGADPKRIYDILNVNAEESLIIKRLVYDNYQFTKGGSIYVYFNDEQRKSIGLDAVQVANNVFLISNISGHPVWLFLCEQDNRLKVEIRSSGPSIGHIGTYYGGGGHDLACGFTLQKFDNQIVEEILEKCDLVIKEYKEKNKLCGKKN